MASLGFRYGGIRAAAAAAAQQQQQQQQLHEDSDRTTESGFTDALEEFRISCPSCSHQFTLGEGLLMEASRRDGEAASQCSDTARDSMDSLTTDLAAADPDDELLKAVASGTATYPEAAAASGDDPTSDTSGAGATAGDSVDDAKNSQPVSRCYQILNWTVEELEKLICDPNDRRIRKISSISECDIEVRSEMAPSRFGAPKNFCVLRAAQPVSIDQCCSMLRRQLLWVLTPRSQDPQSVPGAQQPQSPSRP